MPKPPTIERFLLTCETNAADLGPIIAQLTRMGLTNIKFDLLTEHHTYRQKTVHEVSAEEFLREWIKEHATFTASEAVKYGREQGRTDGSIYTALRVLVDKHVLKKISSGNYSRTDVKQLAAPKKVSKQVERDHFEITHPDFILRIMRQSAGRISVAKLKARFERDGRKTTSVDGAVAKLVGKKMIKAMGDGEYVLLSAGGAKPKPKPKSPPNGPNGVAAPVTEETANG